MGGLYFLLMKTQLLVVFFNDKKILIFFARLNENGCFKFSLLTDRPRRPVFIRAMCPDV